jgi:hypothetical protein
VRLTIEEIRFFKTQGYLIKRGILDPKLTARARDRLWDNAPPSLRRDDPDTWIGPIREEEVSEERANYKKGFRWQYRAPGREPWMVQLLARNADVWEMAEQLLGKGQLVEPSGIRGIYCTLPYGDEPARANGCHVDAHPFHLGVVGYIDDVPEGGGSFSVWPGSHLEFYPTFITRYKRDATEQYEPLRARLNDQAPVDCWGRAGDILFWHHRIGHMAGHNRSRQIRQAVLYDFVKKEIEETQDEPPLEDMWLDWSGEVQAAG